MNYTSWENFPGFSWERLSCFSSLPHTILYIRLIIVSWRNQASRLRYFKLPIMQKNDDYPTRIELGIAAAVNTDSPYIWWVPYRCSKSYSDPPVHYVEEWWWCGTTLSFGDMGGVLAPRQNPLGVWFGAQGGLVVFGGVWRPWRRRQHLWRPLAA